MTQKKSALYIKIGTVSKRASNGRTLYKLPQSPTEAAAEAKANETKEGGTAQDPMNDF